MHCEKCGKLIVNYHTCSVCLKHFCDEHITNHDHVGEFPPPHAPLAG